MWSTDELAVTTSSSSDSELCGADVVTARFSRPAGFDFTAGQWIVLTLAERRAAARRDVHDLLGAERRLPRDHDAALRLGVQERARATGSGRPRPRDGAGRAAGASRRTRSASRSWSGEWASRRCEACSETPWSRGAVFDDALLFYGNRDDSCVPFEEEFEAMADIGVRTVLCFEHPPIGLDRGTRLHHRRDGRPAPRARAARTALHRRGTTSDGRGDGTGARRAGRARRPPACRTIRPASTVHVRRPRGSCPRDRLGPMKGTSLSVRVAVHVRRMSIGDIPWNCSHVPASPSR